MRRPPETLTSRGGASIVRRMHRMTTSCLTLALALGALSLSGCGDDGNPGDTDSTGNGTTVQATMNGTSVGGETSTGGTTVEPTTAAQTSVEPTTAGEDTDTGGALDCATYCATIMANCGGGNMQYSSEASCLGACAAFDPGTAADTSGNTLGCRTYHAGAAASDPGLHCAHAGPSGGGGACGDYCPSFCAIATTICPTEHPAATCEATCGMWDTTEPYDASDASGDSYACRLYHLTVAATDAASAMMHCPHTLAVSTTCL